MQQRTKECLANGRYALDILSESPERFGPLAFDVGYFYRASWDDFDRSAVADFAGVANQNLGLVLAAVADETEIAIDFSYRPGRFDAPAIRQIGNHLFSILRQAAVNPSTLLDEMMAGSDAELDELCLAADAEEAFSF